MIALRTNVERSALGLTSVLQGRMGASTHEADALVAERRHQRPHGMVN